MARAENKAVKVNWDYLNKLFHDNGLTQAGVCELLGRSHSYFSYYVRNNKITEADLGYLRDLLEIDDEILFLNGTPKTPTKEVSTDVVTCLIAEIGELRGKIAELEKRLEQPVKVSIPMNAKDMANRVMGSLLDGGWTSRDEVLVEFNKHNIPIEYISDALRANHAISATSGVANCARTFYIKESEVGIA